MLGVFIFNTVNVKRAARRFRDYQFGCFFSDFNSFAVEINEAKSCSFSSAFSLVLYISNISTNYYLISHHFTTS